MLPSTEIFERPGRRSQRSRSDPDSALTALLAARALVVADAPEGESVSEALEGVSASLLHPKAALTKPATRSPRSECCTWIMILLS